MHSTFGKVADHSCKNNVHANAAFPMIRLDTVEKVTVLIVVTCLSNVRSALLTLQLLTRPSTTIQRLLSGTDDRTEDGQMITFGSFGKTTFIPVPY